MLVKIGEHIRETERLTVVDYFAAGGRSIAHYCTITGKQAKLSKLKVSELHCICSSLKIKFDDNKKADLISLIKHEII